MISKTDSKIGIIKSFSQKFLVNYLQSFMRPLLDCWDTIYDQPNNDIFVPKLKENSAILH